VRFTRSCRSPMRSVHRCMWESEPADRSICRTATFSEETPMEPSSIKFGRWKWSSLVLHPRPISSHRVQFQPRRYFNLTLPGRFRARTAPLTRRGAAILSFFTGILPRYIRGKMEKGWWGVREADGHLFFSRWKNHTELKYMSGIIAWFMFMTIARYFCVSLVRKNIVSWE